MLPKHVFVLLVHVILLYFVEVLTSKETVEIESKDPEKLHNVNTFIHGWILILNEMVAAINEMTSESDVRQIYESILDFIRNNKIEPENVLLKNLLQKLQEKIQSYAKLKECGVNQIPILAKFAQFYSVLVKEYGILAVKCSEGSILLLVTFTTRKGYDLYKKDLENGRIGEQILELFLYPPFLESFGLKADDIEISLNGSLLAQHKGKKGVKHLQCSGILFLSYNHIFRYCVALLVNLYFRFVLFFYNSSFDMDVFHRI